LNSSDPTLFERYQPDELPLTGAATSQESIQAILRLFLDCAPHVEKVGAELEDLLQAKGLPPGVAKVEPWAQLYEMPFLQHAAFVIHVIGATDELKILVKSDTPNLALLRSVISEVDTESVSEIPLARFPEMLGATLSMLFNGRAIGFFGMPINRMLRIGAAGNDAVLLDALRIDPTVASCETFSVRLARAVALQERRFLSEVHAAVRDNAAKRPNDLFPRARHPQLKYCLSILEDAGQLDTLSEKAAYDLFAVYLGVYPLEGGPKDASRSLWKLIDRWKRLVRAT
jgi:hypothetical protein